MRSLVLTAGGFEIPRVLRLPKRFARVLAVALAALVVLLPAGLAWQLDRQEARQARLKVLRVSQVWDRLRHESERQLAWLAAQAAADPVLQEAMRRGDAESLLAHAGPRHQEMRTHFGVSHWTFFTPDRRVVLRVHAPADRGDRVDRKTLLDAAAGDRTATGMEIGATATPTLRHVIAWRSRGDLLGYIEIGKEIGWVNSLVKDVQDVEIVAAVHKTFASESAYAKGREKLDRPEKWDDHPTLAVTHRTLGAAPAALFPAWQRFVDNNGPGTVDIRDRDRTWSAGFVLLRDSLDRPVASLAILSNGDQAAAQRLMRLWGIAGITAVLAALLAFAMIALARHRRARPPAGPAAGGAAADLRDTDGQA